jgi:hypothetical protein
MRSHNFVSDKLPNCLGYSPMEFTNLEGSGVSQFLESSQRSQMLGGWARNSSHHYYYYSRKLGKQEPRPAAEP